MNKHASSKILKLKKWVTLSESAQILSKAIDEDVNEADILRFGLDGHLKLSVRFVNRVFAISGKFTSFDDEEISEIVKKFKQNEITKNDLAITLKCIRIPKFENTEITDLNSLLLDSIYDLAPNFQTPS